MVSSLTSSGLKLSAAAIAGAGALALQPLTVRVVLGSSPMGLVRIASTFSAAAIGLISILLSRWFLPLAIRDRRPGNRDRRPDAIGLISNLAGFFSLGVIAFGPFVITRFFGIGTRVAHQLTVLMAVGDSVRPLGVMFAMCLVAGGRDGTFTLLEVAFGVVYLALTATLGAVFGVIGVPIAYLLAYGLYTAVAAILVVRSGEFRNAVEAIRLAAAPVAACTAAGALSLLGGPSIGAAASAALLVVLAAVKKPWRVRTRLVQNPRHAPAAFV